MGSTVSPGISLPDRYRVVRHIANGGMAGVWAAEDQVLQRLVAVKVLSPAFAADDSARQRFTREARAAARVSDHPNVVTIYDVGEHEDRAFIVMECFAGGTVAERLREDQPVPPPTALRWLGEAAAALDAAHAADIVHRDVKPGNLLLDADGRLAVADFGIASIAGETSVTLVGQVLGTAAYLAPERARGEPATPASDRYSLAVVAFELLCGHRPFGGDTPVAQALAHAESEPPRPDGPCSAANDVLAWGLSKDPRQRPSSSAGFVGALHEALGSLGQATALPVTETAPTERAAAAVADERFARRPRAPRAPAVPPLLGPAAARRHAGRPRPALTRNGPLAALAAVFAIGLVALALASALGGGDGGGADSAADRAPQAERKAPAEKQQPAKEPAAPVPSDGRSPEELNNAGFAMLPGNPGEALPLLQSAVSGFREQGRRDVVDYAYSLYNLGWALRLSGRPAEAIPYLEERLEISDFKEGVVKDELKTAKREAGKSDGGKAKSDDED